MAGLIYHPRSKKEIRDTVAYFEAVRDGLGQRFLETLEVTIKRVKRFPRAGRTLGNSVRQALVGKFPYGLIYIPTDEYIYVVALMHLKRKPGYWMNRLSDVE